MRVLFVPYVLPPLQYPAALCYHKLLLGLAMQDAEIEVCHVDPASYRHFGSPALDLALASKLPQNVIYLPVSSPETGLFYRKINANPKISRLFYFLTQPTKREWIGAAKALLARRNPRRYDAVVTCSQPNCNHLLGLWLKENYSIPWISYFSDPWVDNPYSHLRNDAFLRAHQARMEAKVVAASDLVLFTSEETRTLVMGKYPEIPREKSGVLPHCYVPGWYRRQSGALNEAKEGAKGEGPLTMLHAGNFYGPRSPRPVIDALSELERKKGISGRFRLRMVGGMRDADRTYAREQGVGHLIEFHPTVPYLDSLALQSRADWLLLVDAPSPDGPSVFLPSKLIDYFGSDKPILGVTPIPGTSARVLAEAGHPVRDLFDHAGLVEIFARIADGWIPDRPDVSADFEVGSVGRTFLGFVERAVARGRPLGKTAKSAR
ncbi:hypothetical protein dsx2_1178 [Desulfovibrio sp. X2]|uniref:hypothetical protein n=1 Tax=Desulfovibrio sp. X2 TaxID=941449 RepID=UPI000358B361|nr:hypothetical protein [Desulfovibrio sp. X2]EPR37235.1 hypothetical protein dsx2_1178 [Desulfovibrio sp. X2]